MVFSPKSAFWLLQKKAPFRLAIIATGLAMLIGDLISQSDNEKAAKVFTNISEVRQLEDAVLKTQPPVKLRGVVTYAYRNISAFIMQGDSDAIYVDILGHPALPLGLQIGSVVEIEGVANPGHFAPIAKISKHKLRTIGSAPLPKPIPLNAEAALSGSLDAHLVVVEGVVRRAGPHPLQKTTHSIELMFENTRLTVFLDEEEISFLGKILDARVRILGISSGLWNTEKQIIDPCIYSIGRDAVTILKEAQSDPFLLPKISVAEIMRYHPKNRPGHLIHTTGTVLYAAPDRRVYVFDGENSVCVECVDMPKIAPGDIVDIAGFPRVKDHSLFLEDAVMRTTGHRVPSPPPKSYKTGDLLEQGKNYELVQTEAVLLELSQNKKGADLLLQNGEGIFKATLHKSDSDSTWSDLQPGSTLSLLGLVLFNYKPDTIHPTYQPSSFSFLLRAPSDVRVIQKPSWWTEKRLFGILGVVLAVALIFGLWNHFLREHTKAQKEIINAQARREATSEERTRLARELHDTLEQEFVGMMRQSEALECACPLPTPALEKLDTLRQMLQISRENARRAVWDLRDPVLLDCGLEAAIGNTLQRITNGKNIALNFCAKIATPITIASNVQLNILRLAQEAVTNAVKHSDAKNIEVVLETHTGILKLTVRDDGQGSESTDTQANISGGHFGIIGMRERCEKLGGYFELCSQQGNGTTVRAEIPI